MRRDRSTSPHCLVILGGKCSHRDCVVMEIVNMINHFSCRAILEYDIEQYMHISFLFDFKGFSAVVICKCWSFLKVC